MINKIKYLVVLLLTLVACSGTNSLTSEDVGEISLNLLNVPSEVQCLRITATNSVRIVERDIPLTTSTGGTGGISNVADETPLQGLPTGDVTVSANAYGVTCENIVSTTIPTWKSYPMEQIVEIVEGVPYAWELVLRPNGYVEPSVDWQGDEEIIENITTCSFSIPKWDMMLHDPQFVYTITNCNVSVTCREFWTETGTLLNNGVPSTGTLSYTELCESDACAYKFTFSCVGNVLTITHSGTPTNTVVCACPTNC